MTMVPVRQVRQSFRNIDVDPRQLSPPTGRPCSTATVASEERARHEWKSASASRREQSLSVFWPPDHSLYHVRRRISISAG